MADAFQLDLITPLLILCGIVLPFARRDKTQIPLGLGVLLYVLYVIWIGGDFMSGRFLTAPFLLSTALFVQTTLESRKVSVPVFACILALGLLLPCPTVFSGAAYIGRHVLLHPDGKKEAKVSPRGIADERGYWFHISGLLNYNPNTMFAGSYVYRSMGARFAVGEAVGRLSYDAGPTVYFLDEFALTNPFLARMPMSKDQV
jgi:arabinofuranosyltransferase